VGGAGARARPTMGWETPGRAGDEETGVGRAVPGPGQQWGQRRRVGPTMGRLVQSRRRWAGPAMGTTTAVEW
jgi:hypothetical protein